MFNVVFTDEGRALIAEIASDPDYSLLISDVKYSEHDYTGQEASVTEATFTGDFASGTKSISVVDSTTMRIETYFNNQYINEQKDLYSIGIFAKCVKFNGMIYTEIDSGLLAICTVSTPRIIPPYADAPFSVFTYNINLAVGSADNVTVVETQAGVQYKELATPITINGTQETTVEGALSGLNDYGDALADNLAANENVYGAKNLLDINNLGSMSAYKCHVANNGFVNDETDTLNYFRLRLVAYDANGQIIQVGGNNYVFSENVTTTGQKEITGFALPAGTANVLLTHTGTNINIYVNPTVNLDIIEIPLTLSFNANGINPSSIGGLDIRDIMIRDARILDPTFAPYEETNLQLTRKISGLSNENHADNGWFTVNQRGFTSGSGTSLVGKYISDRWFVPAAEATATMSADANGVTLGGEGSIRQKINGTGLLGKIFCLSVKLQNGDIISDHATIPATTPSVYTKVIELTLNANAKAELSYNANQSSWQIHVSTTSGTTSIRAVKLEPGTVSTLANDVEPNYTMELLKCQWYFERVKLLGSANSYALFGMGYADSTAGARVIIWCQPKRTLPALSFTGSFYLGTNAVTGMAAQQMTNAGIAANVASSGLVQDNLYVLVAGNTGYYIDLSSDL